MVDLTTGGFLETERGLPQVQYAFLELPKYAAGDAPRALIDKWAYFFREAKNLSVVPLKPQIPRPILTSPAKHTGSTES